MAIAQDKISELENEVVTLVTLLLSSVADEGESALELDSVTAQVERIARAATDSGMQGLGDVSMLFANCLSKLARSDVELSDELGEKLQAWPNQVMAYLDNPGDLEAAQSLLENLWDPIWHLDLPNDEIDILLDELVEVAKQDVQQSTSEGSAAEPERPEYELIAEWDVNSDDDIPMPEDSAEDENEGVSEADSSFDFDNEQLMSEELSSSIVDEEMVGLLGNEIEQLHELLALSLEHIEQSDDGKIRKDAFDDYMDALERLTAASMAVGLMGLHRFFSCLTANMELIRESDHLTPHQHEILNEWPQRVEHYLNDLSSTEVSEHLVDLICDIRWPKPLNENNADTLVNLLSSVQQGAAPVQDDAPVRPAQAEPDDVSLLVPDDINPELLETLLQELPTNTADFSAAIMSVLNEGNFEGIDQAQRIAHTVKGAANTVGVRGIANVTHHLEDILSALAKAQQLPSKTLGETLLSASDCLESMSESLVSMEPPPSEAQEVLQDILDWANRIDREGVPKDEIEPHPSESRITPQDAATAQQQASTAEAVQAVPMMRVQADVIDDLLRLSGETMILTGQVKERLVNTFRQAQAVAQQNHQIQSVIAELEDMIEMHGVSAPFAEQKATVSEREGDYDFDPLEFEQYNEVHSTIRKLMEMATDSGEMSQGVRGQLSSLNELLEGLRRVNNENQESVLRTRMVPVKTIVPRLQRGVRQASRLTGKDVEMQVIGSETFIDSSILNELVDPLMHILRNSVDHGIESSEIRIARDKPAKGLIVLEILREGSHIVVRCEDDGGGLDFDSIRSTAIARGLISAEMNPSHDELTRLILSPGFSTRHEATQISGRGIGMDVVQNRISEMKGIMQIHTEPGLGSLIELKFPVSLLSTHALLIRARNKVLAVSERGVKQILYAGAGEIRSLGGQMTYYVGDEVYPAQHIEDLLNLPTDRRLDDRNPRPVLLVEDETGEAHAIFVQEVFDSRSLVVKGMGDYVPKIRAIPGATILGDGSIVPVIDMPDLLREPAELGYGIDTGDALQAGPSQSLPLALVVDDSLSARRSMAQFMQDAGFQVRTAIDGFDAASILDKVKPDIMMVDMEMPRMNGVELTSRVRADEKTRDIPVFMITSRSTEKHRQMAMDAGVNVYMTKPYGEDALLEQIEQIMLGN